MKSFQCYMVEDNITCGLVICGLSCWVKFSLIYLFIYLFSEKALNFVKCFFCFFVVVVVVVFLLSFLPLLGPLPQHMEVPRGPIGAVATSHSHSHSNVGSKLCPQPTPQLTTRPDPQSTEQGQGSNPQPHGSSLDLLTTEPRGELLSNASSASIEMIRWFLSLILLVWSIILFDLCMSDCPGINPTWSWCVILLRTPFEIGLNVIL